MDTIPAMKRNQPNTLLGSPTNKKSKKPKIDDTIYYKQIIIRNDTDPHIFLPGNYGYVKMGNFVYKVRSDINGLVDNSVGVNLVQFNDVKDFIFDKKIMVKNFIDKIQPVKKLIINLKNPSSCKFIINRIEFTKYLVLYLSNHVVTVDQHFNVNFNNMDVEIVVKSIDSNIFMGMVSPETEIDFKNHENDNIVIYDKCIDLTRNMVKIHVTKCISLKFPSDANENNNTNEFPLTIDKTILNSYTKNAFTNVFTNDDILKYRYNNYEFTFNIRLVEQNKQSKFKNTYKLVGNELSEIISETNNLIVTDGSANAKKICFSFEKIPNKKYDVTDCIIFVDDVIKYIRNNYKTITNKQTIKYKNRNKEFQLNISYINPHSNDILMYKLDSNTKITFDTNVKSEFVYVKNNVPNEIKKIVFKIKKVKGLGGFFFFITGGDDKISVIDGKKLEKLLRNMFPKNTAIGHRMKITYSGQKCNIAVKDTIFNDEVKKPTKKEKYKTLGCITENTEFKFEISKNNKSMTINEKKELPPNPIGEMEKYVGGLSEQLKTIVRTIYLARGKLKEEFLDRGLKPIKGMVFHGPPGTGKTALARNLGKVFGCEGDRFNLMSGPEVFAKWVGKSEENVRNIFKPAKDAWKKYGMESPLYMVVIDEIDAMLPLRAGSTGHPVRDSVVNQFLAEIDGLVEFNNLICIGLTNRLELLDPAVLRPGRLETHVKIDLPDRKGRLRIFEIHTEKLKEMKRLDNIDFDSLADLTEKYSGAEIEGLVKAASNYSLERLSKLDTIDKEIIDRQGKITQEDFKKAINDMNKNDNSHLYKSMFI